MIEFAAMDMYVAVLLFVGTGVQAMVNLWELADSKRPVIAEWAAEDDLLKELPRRRRRAARKELVGMRTRDTDRAIVRLELALAGWVLLMLGSLVALIKAATA